MGEFFVNQWKWIVGAYLVAIIVLVVVLLAETRSEALEWFKALGPWFVGLGGFAFGYWNTTNASNRADDRVELQLEHDKTIREEERTGELLAQRERLARVLFGETETNLSLIEYHSTFEDMKFWTHFFDQDMPFSYMTMLSDPVLEGIGVLSTETVVAVQDYYSRMREFKMLKLTVNTGRVTPDDIRRQVKGQKPQRIFSNLHFSVLQLRASLATQLPEGDPAADRAESYWIAAREHAEKHSRRFNEKQRLFSFASGPQATT
jgi:hypothetical protein